MLYGGLNGKEIKKEDIYLYVWPSLVPQVVKNRPAMQENKVRSLGQEDPLRSDWLATPVFLPGEFHGQRWATVHGSQ